MGKEEIKVGEEKVEFTRWIYGCEKVRERDRERERERDRERELKVEAEKK